MGTVKSSHDWQPPPQPMGNLSSEPPVEYHMVASEVVLRQTSDCSCYPKVHVAIDIDDLYTLLGEQFTKGYRMLYFTRMPGDLQLKMSSNIFACFTGFFRMNPNLGEWLEGPVSWQLRVQRSWVQSRIENTGSFLSPKQRRTVDTTQLVASIARNTQCGERLVAATETGHSEPQHSYGAYSSGLGPSVAMDLFFEVPTPAPKEHYEYNIALIPAHVEYTHSANVFFPEIQCNWMTAFQHHLSQGWRLIDIYIDTPMVEQFRIPHKSRPYFCRPTDTSGLWIFERPASVAQNPRPLFEGIVREETVPVQLTRCGVTSAPEWLPLIQDLGMRGWELSCVVESHKIDSSSQLATTLHIKSLLFFQRPVTQRRV
ncbi:hypothetical protein ACOMHN_032399 [Nucella lapillus]